MNKNNNNNNDKVHRSSYTFPYNVVIPMPLNTALEFDRIGYLLNKMNNQTIISFFFFNFGYKLIWGRTNEWRFLNSILLEKKKRLKSRSLERTDLVHFKGSFLHWNICAMGNVEAQRNLIFYLHIMSWLRRLSFTLLQCDPSISVNILCFLLFLLPSIIINRFRLYLSANGIVDWRI